MGHNAVVRRFSMKRRLAVRASRALRTCELERDSMAKVTPTEVRAAAAKRHYEPKILDNTGCGDVVEEIVAGILSSPPIENTAAVSGPAGTSSTAATVRGCSSSRLLHVNAGNPRTRSDRRCSQSSGRPAIMRTALTGYNASPDPVRRHLHLRLARRDRRRHLRSG